MIVTPVMTYCSQLHASLTATQINKLSSIASRATNLIDNPTSTVMSIEKLMIVKNCLFVRRCTEKCSCEIFDNYFEVNAHWKNTRSNNALLKLHKVKREFERKGFYFFGAKLYRLMTYKRCPKAKYLISVLNEN